jgi:ribosomal protein L32
MGQPKKRTSPRRTRSRRSHLVLKLARQVNAKSPIKAYTTKRESAKTLVSKVAKAKKSSTTPAK